MGSEQRMVERNLEQESALKQVLGADQKTSHIIPSWQDIDVLESVNKALGPLQEFTDIMSGEKYVTVSGIKSILKKRRCKWMEMLTHHSPVTSGGGSWFPS